MKNKKMKRRWHIKPRIFAMLAIMLVIVFASIFIALNLFTRSYIRTNVQNQLDELVRSAGMYDDKPADKGPGGPYLPDLSGQPKNKIGARGEVLILDANYALQGYDELGTHENAQELAQIASSLKEQAVPLANARNVLVETDQGAYYVSSVEDAQQPGSYFVFYVSMAGTGHLVDAVNLALAVIMAAAMLICFFIANVIAGSVTRPVQALSAFAEQLGKGNFKRKNFAFQDIEFDELGEAMNQSAEKLEAYDKDQRTFFQNASHELRTPLQSIRCYAEGVQVGLMDPKKSSTTIIAETDRLSELVEDLLYISRVDNLSAHLEKRENDLRDTLSLCAENLRSVAAKNGLEITYQFDENPVLFSYNEKYMYRAFSNLLSNALRYAKSTITLRCTQANGQIEISVTDDGPGISDADLPHIFERFYKGRDGKHGIGLSIAKSVVELHGGSISATCAGGTRFTILFPAQPAQQ